MTSTTTDTIRRLARLRQIERQRARAHGCNCSPLIDLVEMETGHSVGTQHAPTCQLGDR